jgi:hypothetical protein
MERSAWVYALVSSRKWPRSTMIELQCMELFLSAIHLMPGPQKLERGGFSKNPDEKNDDDNDEKQSASDVH